MEEIDEGSQFEGFKETIVDILEQGIIVYTLQVLYNKMLQKESRV